MPLSADGGAPIAARAREKPEDFNVEELAAYPPSGEGEHLFVRFEKKGLSTPEAVSAIASALSVDPQAAGWAGLKDRHAVTTQWASFFGADREAALGFATDQIRVLEAERHGHKIRTGHLRGNAFSIFLRGVAPDLADEVIGRLERLGETGHANYYGPQRFGRDGDNARRALAWIEGKGRGPSGRFQRKLLVSSLQSLLFNATVADRVAEGLLHRPVEGDVFRKEDSGGLFTTTDRDDVQRRMDVWDISPTGPMFGKKMRPAESRTAERERSVLERFSLSEDTFARLGRIALGTRRPMRVRIAGASAEPEPEGVRVRFALPKGAFATVALRELLRDDEVSRLPETVDESL